MLHTVYLERVVVFKALYSIEDTSLHTIRNYPEFALSFLRCNNAYVDSVQETYIKTWGVDTHECTKLIRASAVKSRENIIDSNSSTEYFRFIRIVLFLDACRVVELALIVSSALFDWCGTYFFRFFWLLR